MTLRISPHLLNGIEVHHLGNSLLLLGVLGNGLGLQQVALRAVLVTLEPNRDDSSHVATQHDTTGYERCL